MLGLTLSVGLAGGCGRSQPEDNAPFDIRGQPIAEVHLQSNSSLTSMHDLAIGPIVISGQAVYHQDHMPVINEVDGVVEVGFDTLAGFAYPTSNDPLTADAPLSPSPIPEHVRRLGGKTTAIKGFMLPMKLQNGLATELLLMRDQSMCCFGVMPKINEWVNVKMTGRGVKPVQDQPVTIFGTMQVGEIYEHGYLVSIYSLEGKGMETALDQ
ncbi:MAG: hypothetical protein ACYDC1_18170 [Limisphaerales bacterium]